MKTLVMLLVVLALGVVSCREAPEAALKRGVESVERMVAQGDLAGACKLLLKMSGEDRFAAQREALQGRYATCFVEYARQLSAGGQGDAVIRQMEEAMAKLPAAMALTMAGRVAPVMIDAGAVKQASQIPTLIERVVPDSKDRRGVLCEIRVAVLIKEGAVKEAQAYYRREWVAIPDANAVSGLHLLAKALPDGGAALGLEVLDGSAGRTVLQEAAAGVWVKAANGRGDGAEVAKRLVAIRQKGLSDRFVINVVDDSYSVLLRNPSEEVLAPVYAMYEKMYAAATNRGIRRRLAGYMLDMGYFLEKYAEALKLVEDGALGGAENPQTEVFICKIKGHLALKEGRVDDAIGHFRQFMGFIEKEARAKEMDPLDQTWVTREMILGLNAKRIGDILVKAGRVKESAAVYQEARGYYEKAIKDFPDEASKENRKLRKQLSELPSA